jgi:DMSO/TMAO reductase YedYZ molybdopterin-dependent catalytic subunit
MKRLAGMAAWALAMALAAAAAAQTVAVTGLAGQKLELSAADIAALPHQPATLQLEGGRSEACDGVPLSAVLAKAGAPQGKALRGPELADVVVVGAADGYRVALALAETDPLMRPTPVVFLADRCSGAPIPAAEGPFRLIVLGEGRPARSARQVTSIALLRP